jgi:pSer/pThr/pTyr-binding forkhead associated (FHA) protein
MAQGRDILAESCGFVDCGFPMSALLLSNLGVICPSCDFLNPQGASTCGACASSLSAPARTGLPEAPVAAQSVPPGLRRATGNTPAIPAPDKTPPQSFEPGPTAPTPQATAPVPPPTPRPAVPPPKTTTGPVGRPTFESSANAGAPKFGVTVVGGPARGQRFRLSATGAQIGRSKGVILFPDDPFCSPLHATIAVRDGKLFVRDEGSTSGVYLSINGQETIPPNSYFATGLRLFRYAGAVEPAPPFMPGRLVIYGAPVPANTVNYCVEEILLGDRPGRAMITAGPILTIGSGKCDLSYPNDEGLAPRHCELSPMPTGAMIRDLSGRLGTYVRLTSERAVKAGDRLRVGAQILQIEAL